MRVAFPMDRHHLRSKRRLYARTWILDDPYSHHNFRDMRSEARLGIPRSEIFIRFRKAASHLPNIVGHHRVGGDDCLLHCSTKSILPKGPADIKSQGNIIIEKLRPELIPAARAEK